MNPRRSPQPEGSSIDARVNNGRAERPAETDLLARFHRDQEGQAIVFIALALLMLSLFAVMMVNSGSLVNHEIENQNAADAATYSGGRWLARGMNGVAATNATASTFFTFILISHGVIGLQTSAEIVNAISKSIASGIKAIPIVGSFIGGVLSAAQVPADIMLKGNKKLSKPSKKVIDVLWSSMTVLNGLSKFWVYGAPIMAEVESMRVARANRSDLGFVVNYDKAIPQLPLRNQDDDGENFFSDEDPETRDICTMIKFGNLDRTDQLEESFSESDDSKGLTCRPIPSDYVQPFALLNPEGDGIFTTGAITNPRGDGTLTYYAPIPDYSSPGEVETRSDAYGGMGEDDDHLLYGCSWEVIPYREIGALESMMEYISEVAGPSMSVKLLGNPFYLAYFIIGGLWGLVVSVIESIINEILDAIPAGPLGGLIDTVKDTIHTILEPFKGLPTKAFFFYHMEINNSLRDYCGQIDGSESESEEEPKVTITDYEQCWDYFNGIKLSGDEIAGRKAENLADLANPADDRNMQWTGFRSYCMEFEGDTTMYIWEPDHITQRGWGNGADDTLWGPREYYQNPDSKSAPNFGCSSKARDAGLCVPLADGPLVGQERPAVLINSGAYRNASSKDPTCDSASGPRLCLNCTTRQDATNELGGYLTASCRSDCFSASNVYPCFSDASSGHPDPRGHDCSFNYPTESDGEINDPIDLNEIPPLYRYSENFIATFFDIDSIVRDTNLDVFNYQRTYRDEYDDDAGVFPLRPQVDNDVCLAQLHYDCQQDFLACESAANADPEDALTIGLCNQAKNDCDAAEADCGDSLGWRSVFVYRRWSCENSWYGASGSFNCEKDGYDFGKFGCCYNEGTSSGDQGGLYTYYRVESAFLSCQVPVSWLEVEVETYEFVNEDDEEPVVQDPPPTWSCGIPDGNDDPANCMDPPPCDSCSDTEVCEDGECVDVASAADDDDDSSGGSSSNCRSKKGSHLMGGYWPKKCPEFEPYIMYGDEEIIEKRFNLLGMAFRDRRKSLARSEKGIGDFQNKLPLMSFAQVKIFNPTETNAWSQDWDARLTPIRRPGEEDGAFKLSDYFFH